MPTSTRPRDRRDRILGRGRERPPTDGALHLSGGVASSHGDDGATRKPGALRSPWALLALAIGLSFALRAFTGLVRPGPWILPDELLYVDLARSIADGGPPSVRGVTSFGWGVVYPALVSPVWSVFDNPLGAYRATLVVNSLVMSLVAIPAYLLARLVVGQRASLLVGCGALLVPMMVLTGSAMTENLAYPLFIATLWLMGRAVRSPRPGAQAAALAAIAVLTVTRIQGAVLAPAFVAAIVIYSLMLERGHRRAYLSRFLPTAFLLLAGVLVVAIGTAASGAGLGNIFGGRSGAVTGLVLSELPVQIALALGGILVMVAVVPAVASGVVIVEGLSLRSSEPQRLFAALALPTVCGLVAMIALVGTSVEIPGVEGVNERYLFYVVPLLLVGLAAWIEARPRRRRLSAGLVVASAAVIALLPFDRLDADATFYAPALVLWAALPLSPALITAVLTACALGAGILWLGEGSGRRVVVLTASWLALVCVVAIAAHQHHATTAARVSVGRSAAWIDEAVPPREVVPVVWDHRTAVGRRADPAYYSIMVAAVLNRSVGRILRLGPSSYYENVLPTVPVMESASRALVDSSGATMRASFVLVPCSLGVAGRPVARSSDGRLALMHTDGTVRLVAGRSCAAD